MHAASLRLRPRFFGIAIAVVLLLVATLAAAVAWGGPGPIAPLPSINAPFARVDDFMRAVPHDGPSTLAGFSSGGGLVRRFAAGSRQACSTAMCSLRLSCTETHLSTGPATGAGCRSACRAWFFAQAGRRVPVTLVDGVGHIGLTLEPAALAAVLRACAQ